METVNPKGTEQLRKIRKVIKKSGIAVLLAVAVPVIAFGSVYNVQEQDREIAISISDAQAKAASITSEGEGEYMRIMAKAYHDPQRSDFYSFVRSLEAAKKSLAGNGNTLILPGGSPLARIFTGQ